MRYFAIFSAIWNQFPSNKRIYVRREVGDACVGDKAKMSKCLLRGLSSKCLTKYDFQISATLIVRLVTKHYIAIYFCYNVLIGDEMLAKAIYLLCIGILFLLNTRGPGRKTELPAVPWQPNYRN